MKEFSRFFSHTFAVFSQAGHQEAHQASTWQPPIDIYECCEKICIYVELPGADKDKMEVVVDQGVLRIAGYRPKQLPEGVEHVYQMEIPYGSFVRFVRLPERADVDQIQAKYENGYLIIEIPRKAVR
ncbi:MAG: Hsp20/alpha crystallin family protein [FCB group bacterium]|jgi:HSP20 family protein|nr:Hsp20/alpha crystallin family protein [FCB group bacterium]